MVRSKNKGVLDKSFPIEWSEFKNNLLLTNEDGLNVISTRIYTIVNIDTWDKENPLVS